MEYSAPPDDIPENGYPSQRTRERSEPGDLSQDHRTSLLEWIQKREKTLLVQAISDILSPWVTLTELEQIWNEAWKQSS